MYELTARGVLKSFVRTVQFRGIYNLKTRIIIKN